MRIPQALGRRGAAGLLLLALLLAAPAPGRGGEEAPAPSPPSGEPPAPAAGGSTAAEADVLDVPAAPVPPDTDATRAARERLVKVHIEDEGVKSPAVLRAMRKVRRHWFVPEDRRASAYEDRPLPIGEDQTISQPYVVASMTEEADIQPGERVLEIGTGSGYQAAVLAELTSEVFTIEIREPLARRAAATLKGAGYATVKVRHADGYHGWAAKGPFDAILVTAAAPHVPPPLVRQLKPGGRMVIPVGGAFAVQDLVLVTKDAEGRVRTKSLYAVRFVPLTGSLGPRDE